MSTAPETRDFWGVRYTCVFNEGATITGPCILFQHFEKSGIIDELKLRNSKHPDLVYDTLYLASWHPEVTPRGLPVRDLVARSLMYPDQGSHLEWIRRTQLQT